MPRQQLQSSALWGGNRQRRWQRQGSKRLLTQREWPKLQDQLLGRAQGRSLWMREPPRGGEPLGSRTNGRGSTQRDRPCDCGWAVPSIWLRSRVTNCWAFVPR